MKLDPSINDYSDDDFGLSSEKENKPKHPSEDYGLKHRMYSRMINEIISQEKKLNNILNNRLDLKKIAQKLDYTQINKKAKLTRELLKILTSELNESRIDYDFVIDLCNVLSPNLQIQDKRQLIEKLFHNDYNVIRVNDFFDELERDNLNIAIEVINPLDYDEKEIYAIGKFIYDSINNKENFNYVCNELKNLESLHGIDDCSLPTMFLGLVNDNLFYIVNKKTKSILSKKLGIEIYLNPYLYSELKNIFQNLKEHVNLHNFLELYHYINNLDLI